MPIYRESSTTETETDIMSETYDCTNFIVSHIRLSLFNQHQIQSLRFNCVFCFFSHLTNSVQVSSNELNSFLNCPMHAYLSLVVSVRRFVCVSECLSLAYMASLEICHLLTGMHTLWNRCLKSHKHPTNCLFVVKLIQTKTSHIERHLFSHVKKTKTNRTTN